MNKILIWFCLLLISSCGSNKNAASKEQTAPKDTVVRELLMAPPVGTPKWAPNTAVVAVEISSLQRSGGELVMEVLVKKVIGVGAGTPMLASNQKLNLTYPENGEDKAVVDALMSGDKAEMLLSFSNSITEGNAIWFCDKIISRETQE